MFHVSLMVARLDHLGTSIRCTLTHLILQSLPCQLPNVARRTHPRFQANPLQGTLEAASTHGYFPLSRCLNTCTVLHQSMFCPEGSSRPSGVGECPSGFYCPTGIRLSCPVGTYCPREGHWDPMPCPPGQFSAMVGQKACTACPRGYICPGFGRIDPTPCPDGMVCSRVLLTSPNQRCPPGE